MRNLPGRPNPRGEAVHAEIKLVVGQGIGEAQIPGGAESLAWHSGDMGLVEQQLGELRGGLGVRTVRPQGSAEQRAHIRERVERPLGVGHTTPSMALSASTIAARRRSKARRMAATASRFPPTAAIAARWETFETFEVRCPWSLAAAFATGSGAIIHPTRHPVIAYVLATPLSTSSWFLSSGMPAPI